MDRKLWTLIKEAQGKQMDVAMTRGDKSKSTQTDKKNEKCSCQC